MEQMCDLEVDGTPEDIKEVMNFLNVDRTQRSDNKNDLFSFYEFPTSEHSLVTGYTDAELDPLLEKFYADHPANDNHIYFKSYRKNLFKFVAWLSEKYLSCRFKLSWMEKYNGDENLYVIVVEKSCVIFSQHGISYKVGPNMGVFLSENNFQEWVKFHTREEQEKVE